MSIRPMSIESLSKSLVHCPAPLPVLPLSEIRRAWKAAKATMHDKKGAFYNGRGTAVYLAFLARWTAGAMAALMIGPAEPLHPEAQKDVDRITAAAAEARRCSVCGSRTKVAPDTGVCMTCFRAALACNKPEDTDAPAKGD